MHSPPTFTVISLGGEVQSSVMALMASQGAFGRAPDCAIFGRHPLAAAQRLRAPGMAGRPIELPPARRGQRAKPPRGREGPHQPFNLTQLRAHSRMPEGKRRRG